MLTQITEAEAQALIAGAVAKEVKADTEWCKHYVYELPDGRCVEYALDVDDEGKVEERWNLIDPRPNSRERGDA